MKALTMILMANLLTNTTVFAKEATVAGELTKYGFALSQINNGTGHGVGYTFSASVNKGRKTLEVGLIYSDRESKLSGSDVKYRIFLGKTLRIADEDVFFKPYLQYNLMYQKGTSYENDLVTLNDVTYEFPAEPGIEATLSNYISYGNKIKIIGKAYFDASLGFGFYHGSLDKVHGPDTWGIHMGNSGLTYSFKVGIGYSFK